MLVPADAVSVFTDGACSGNPGPGGWAWAVDGGPQGSGHDPATTNQRMEVRAAYESYRFMDVCRPILDFCSGELSSLYFDVRKDSLYCDRPDSVRRRACRTVLDLVFARLTIWLAPLAPFTMDEAWTLRFPASLNTAAGW